MYIRSRKIVICVSDQALQCGIWRAGKLHEFRRFEANKQGEFALSEFIAAHQNLPLLLLVDTVYEDYSPIQIPLVPRQQLKQLLNRKLDQRYQSHTCRTALYLGVYAERRREAQYLLMALTQDDSIHFCLKIIQSQARKLAGIYLLPTLSALLAKHLGVSDEHLLLCEHLNAGLRQTYLQQGNVYFSRLVKKSESDKTHWHALHEAEASKVRLHLSAQRLLPLEKPLVSICLNSGHDQILLEKLSHHSPELDHLDMTALPAVQKMRLPQILIKENPELIHMHLLANGASAPNLIPDHLGRAYRIARLRSLINTANAMLAAVVVCFALWLFYAGHEYDWETHQLKQLVEADERQLKRIEAEFSQSAETLEHMRTAVEFDRLRSHWPVTPIRLMQVLSDALACTDQNVADMIQINSLHWRFDSFPEILAESAQVILKDYSEVNGPVKAENTWLEHLKADQRVRAVKLEPLDAHSVTQFADNGSVKLSSHSFNVSVVLKSAQAGTR